jgi:hypothetical protein
MLRAAKLELSLYNEVEADSTAMSQAMGVVLLSSVASGIGSLSQVGATGFVFGILAALVGWFIWAFLTYVIGTKILPSPRTQASYGELLRTIGFSSSPGIIRILGIVHCHIRLHGCIVFFPFYRLFEHHSDMCQCMSCFFKGLLRYEIFRILKQVRYQHLIFSFLLLSIFFTSI